jgi:hypothetical protein
MASGCAGIWRNRCATTARASRGLVSFAAWLVLPPRTVAKARRITILALARLVKPQAGEVIVNF